MIIMKLSYTVLKQVVDQPYELEMIYKKNLLIKILYDGIILM